MRLIRLYIALGILWLANRLREIADRIIAKASRRR